MATTNDVREAGRALRDSLQAKGDDGTFDPDDSADFRDIHDGLVRRLDAFASSPAHGASSPQYDSFVALAQTAKTSVDGCTPTSAASISKAKANSQSASNALPPITGGH